MPLALPLIPIAVILIPIAGYVATKLTLYAWSLVAPQGRVTWENIVKWIDHNIKQMVEWIAKQAKEGFKKLSWEYYYLADSIRALIQGIDRKIYAVRVYILDYIFSSIWPAINSLAAWRINAAAWLHNYIEANLISLLHWKVNVVAWLHNYIEVNLISLLNWKVNVVAWLHNYIEKSIQALTFNLNRVAGRLWGLEQWTLKEISLLKSQGFAIVTSYVASLASSFAVNTEELLKSLGQKFAQAVGISGIVAVIAEAFDLVSGKAYKSVEEAFDYADDLLVDDLFLAWCRLSAPVLIGEFKDWSKLVQQGFDGITRNV